jgi:Acetyl/propionyl-CoA carboxylase, alpha subunit
LLTKKFANRKVWKAPNPKEVRSIIPGSVTSIDVVEGASVKKGDKLMEYEAMKMHNIIVAPMDATVKKIMVSVGEKLPKGAILIVLK